MQDAKEVKRKDLRGRCDFRTYNNSTGLRRRSGHRERKILLAQTTPELKTSTKVEETQNHNNIQQSGMDSVGMQKVCEEVSH